ncbi:MAG: gene transfer agent family protein [Hyphomicrobiaceae bacterium]
MANQHRGEIEACLDGRPMKLCLTLGALAELESAFGHEDMLSLAKRFEGGRLSARDIVRILGAGLRGAGHDIDDSAIARMRTDGGAAGFVEIVARLLAITFGGPTGAIATEVLRASADEPAPEAPLAPFPGAR